MSRIGRAPIIIPADVTVSVDSDNFVHVKGPKGSLARKISSAMKINIEDGVLTVVRPSDVKLHRAIHGLSRTLINNMVVGVTDGFSKNLEISGVGYRVAKQGNNLNLSLGYSHPVIIEPPKGISLDAPNPNSIVVFGIDKELVGAVAADIRSKRIVGAYRSKDNKDRGIKYVGEKVRHKEGKAGAKGKK